MPKPIRITDEMKQKALNEFSSLLGKLKMSDGKISYSKSFTYEKGKATVIFTPLAYQKTIALLAEFSDEVAWHGSVTRGGENEFIIEDIFVYPQEVTGSTVNTNQEAYTKWLYEFDEEIFSKLRMQGHSHVNMGVSPSGVDSGHREKIVEQLDDSMFYIFMIWNKSMDSHTLIYDMKYNMLYENNDITLQLTCGDIDNFIKDARSKIGKKTHAAVKAVRGVSTVKSGKSKTKTIDQLESDPFFAQDGYPYYGHRYW